MKTFRGIGITTCRVYTDKTRKHCRLVIQMHNTVYQAMIGREVYWMGASVSSEPIKKMQLLNEASAVHEYDITSPDNGDYWRDYFASHTATVSETISTISLCNTSGTVYSDTNVSIAMSIGEVLDVTYRHTWLRADSSINNNLLLLMKNYFHDGYATDKITYLIATLTHDAGTTDVQVGVSFENGAVTDDNIIVKGYPKNTVDDGTLTKVVIKSASGLEILSHTLGVPETWENGETKEVKYTFTWAEYTMST